MTAFVQQMVLGLLIGGLYGLAAAGLSLVFGVLKVLNVAHGQLIMLGGYGAFWLGALAGFDPFAALTLVIPGALAFGAVLYWTLFAWVVRASVRLLSSRLARTVCSQSSASTRSSSARLRMIAVART